VFHLTQEDTLDEALKQLWEKAVTSCFHGVKRISLVTWKVFQWKEDKLGRLLNLKSYICGNGLGLEEVKKCLTKRRLNTALGDTGFPLQISSLFVRELSRSRDGPTLGQRLRQSSNTTHLVHKSRESLKSLPYTLMRKIAGYLPITDAVLCGRISRDWYVGIDNEDFFKQLYEKYIGGVHREDDKTCWKLRTGKVLRALYQEPKSETDILWTACRLGLGRLIERMLTDPRSQIDINAKLQNRATVLETACLREHTHVIRLLLELGANPYVGADDGDSCMHLSVCTNKMSSVQALIDNGVEPNRFNTLLTGPLYTDSLEYANSVDRLFMVRYLLEVGFHRPRSVVEVAISCALEKGRVDPSEIPLWDAMLDDQFRGQ